MKHHGLINDRRYVPVPHDSDARAPAAPVVAAVAVAAAVVAVVAVAVAAAVLDFAAVEIIDMLNLVLVPAAAVAFHCVFETMMICPY